MPHCKSANQYGWPRFNDQKALMASPWAGYFKDVYGYVPASGYPICTFDFWFLYQDKLTKNNIKPPTPLSPKAAGLKEGGWFKTQWGMQPAHGSWIKHTSIPGGFVPDNTWVEITHHQVGTPQAGDETHGAWFVFAPGTNLWWNTGKTKHYSNHGQAAQDLCGHSAGDVQTAICGQAKGLDSYQFIYAG